MRRDEFKDQIIALTKRVYPMVYRLMGNQADSDDVMQEVMLKLWSNRKILKSHPNRLGYIYTIARNSAIDQLNKRTFMSDIDGVRSIASEDTTEALEIRERIESVERAIALLPQQKREIITLHDIDGLKYSEVADITNLKIEHVRVLLSRARHEVRERINRAEDEV